MSQKNSNITNYLLPHITKYKLFEEIGSGAYGVVYKGLREDDGRNVALKRIFVTDKDGNNNIPLSTHRELCALKRLNTYDNDNIVKLYDVVLNRIEGKMCMDLIFELGDYDLEKYLKKFNSSGDMALSKIISLSKQLVGAIHFMHSYCVIHRDLKPANILINKDGTELKITDFGLARILGFDASLTPVVVTLWYRSPEILLQRTYLTACDIWSAGCIIAEMIYGRPVFAGDNEISQIEKIVTRLGFEAINNWPDDNIIDGHSLVKLVDKARSLDAILKRADVAFLKLIKELLRFDPDRRILSSEALPELDKLERVYSQIRNDKTCANCSVSSLSGFSCSGADCEIDTQNEMIVHSVVRNVLEEDDFATIARHQLIPGIDDEDDISINGYPHEQVEIEGGELAVTAADDDDDESSGAVADDDDDNYSSAVATTSCPSETDSCEEGREDLFVRLPDRKESDEVAGDSFSSYRSHDKDNNNWSFSSYAPSSPALADDSSDDDTRAAPSGVADGEIEDDFHKFRDSFIISDASVTAPVAEKTVTPPPQPSVSRKSASMPFREVNDRARLAPIVTAADSSPNGAGAAPHREPYHFVRKRILNPDDDSSESENEPTTAQYQSPIANAATTDSGTNRPSVARHKSLRRRVSMAGPHAPWADDKKGRNALTRCNSVLQAAPIDENDECRDMSFGERSLSRALDTIKSSRLSGRPKIVVRRRSQAKHG